MIFVTVGSMFPFDRLIRLMDAWARDHAPTEILAQIGAGSYLPRHMPWLRQLDQEAFARTVAGARLIVAHAGIGSIFTAGQFGRPIVLLPRLQDLGEHTTNHQIATANWLRANPGIYVADREDDLAPRIAEALAAGEERTLLEPTAPAEFIARIRRSILS